MPSDDSPERRPSFSQASSDDDTEIYVRKDAAPPAPKRAPAPAPVAAPVEEPITLGGEDVEVTEPARRANPDPGPFATFVNPPSKAKHDTPASRPLPASNDDVEVYVGRQPKPEERVASTAETGQFLIAPSQDGDGTYVYPTKAKPKEAKAAPTTNDPHLKNTVDAIHRHQSTAETGAFLIPPNGGGGGSGDSFYEYPSAPKEKTPDSLAKTMVYRGPMSSDGAILYESKPREVPRSDLERAKPTETGSDGTELYVGHKPTRSVQTEPSPSYVLYGGKVEEVKPGIKPGPPTTGPNATKYYANPNVAPGNTMVERTSQFDLYESTPKPKGERAPPHAPSWQDGNAVLYTSKNASQRPADKYPSLVNLKPDRGYDRSVSDSNGFILYEKPKAPREARAPGPVGASDASNGYIYYEKSRAAPTPPAPAPAPVAASSGYELYEEKKAASVPFAAPVAPEPVELPTAVAMQEPALVTDEEESPEPSAPSPGVEEADFEVFERVPPPEPATVAAATLDLVEHIPAPVVEAVPREPVVEAPLDMHLPAAEAVAESPPAPPELAEASEAKRSPQDSGPVVEQAEVVEAEPVAPMFDPTMAEAILGPPEPPALATPLAPPAVVVPEEPEPVMIDIIEDAEAPPIEPEAANVDPTPAIGDLLAESKLEGIDVLEAPLAPLPLEFALGNMPSFPRFETLPTQLPEIESHHGPNPAPTPPKTGLDREAPTLEYVPKEFTLEASARGSVDMRIGFVVSEFNYDITSMMLERAKAHAEFLGAKLGPILHVPGTFDMGLAVKKLLGRKDVDGVVTLGAVIQGETDHDQVVLQHASRKIADLSIESGKPVALGITGPGMTRLQAMERIDRAKDAVEAVVKLHGRLKAIEN